MKKKVNAKELREKRNTERKEMFKNKVSENPAEVQEMKDFTREALEGTVGSDNVEKDFRSGDIECKNHNILLYQITCMPKTKESRDTNRRPQFFILGKYTDEEMRDRAFKAIVEAAKKKYEVTESKWGYIIRGNNSNFNTTFECEIRPTEYTVAVNTLFRDKIDFCLDVEV